MKKLLLLSFIILVTAGFLSAQAAKGGTLYVAVKTVTLKSNTGFFSNNIGTLYYGDIVTVLQVNGKFVEVQSAVKSSLTGWTTLSNLSAKQIVSGDTTSLSFNDVGMAGKGFNHELEEAYKKSENLNYANVDKSEAITVQETDISRFLEDGLLSNGDNE